MVVGGSFVLELRDDVDGHQTVLVEWPKFPNTVIRRHDIDFSTAGTFFPTFNPGTRLALIVPPAVAPGGTVTMKSGAGDTGILISTSNPTLLAITDATFLRFVTSADAGVWTFNFV